MGTPAASLPGRGSRPPLAAVLGALGKHHGDPPAPPTRDAFELILWENASYIVDDDRRDAVFAALKKGIGTRPADLLGAKKGAIEKVIKDGGMRPPMRAEKLREASRILEDLGGDLDAVLDRGGKEAMAALKRFPGMGEPGAEKVLLLSGRVPVLALDSNGLRTLQRLGFGRDEGSYPRTYRSVRTAADPEVPRSVEEVRRAHLLLRAHGKTVCRRSDPLCAECPLREQCPTGATR
jgi:endonuclease-3